MPRPSRILVTVAAATLVGTLLGACASGDGASPAASSPSVPDLAGTSWNLTSYTGSGGTQTPAVTDPSVGTLTFLAGGKLAGSTGCNRFTGTFTQSGADLTITTGAMTMMACPGPAAEQETAVIAALGKVATAAVASDQLVLKDAQGAQLLVYAPGLAGLEGTSWTATGVNNGRQAVVSDATTTTITAEFGKDNALSGFGGCNTYTSTWTTTEPDGLTIGPVASTLKACEQGVMDTEQQYFAALAKVATYQVEGNQLTLRDADGAVQVSYTQATG
jgi:heat shock protein HslJ